MRHPHYSVSLHAETGYALLYEGSSAAKAEEQVKQLRRILETLKGTGSIYFHQNGTLTVTHLVNGAKYSGFAVDEKTGYTPDNL